MLTMSILNGSKIARISLENREFRFIFCCSGEIQILLLTKMCYLVLTPHPRLAAVESQ